MNCFLYARVSTGAQANRQLSIPAQLGAMREYASRQGWTIVEEFLEAGVSGRSTGRPELVRMLERCRSGERVDIVIVHKVDRLARNITDHVAIRALLGKARIRLVSVSENLDDESVSGRLIENIMASLAEFYSANLAEEVRKGLTQRVKRGGWPHLTPFGYRRGAWSGFGPRPIEAHPEHAALVRTVFEAVASGRTGFRGLAIWASRQGWRISKSGLHRMLRNPFYTGQMLWKGDLYVGHHPPIVSRELFDRVQVLLKERHRPYVYQPENHSLLHGFARCAACGALVSSEHHKRWAYYRCRSTQRSRERCRARFMNVDHIHQHLAAVYSSLPNTQGVQRRMKERQQMAWGALVWEGQRQVSVHRRRVSDLETRELRLAEALRDGLLSPEIFRLAIEELRRDRAVVEAKTPATSRSRPASPELGTARTVLGLHEILDPSDQRLLIECVFAELHISHAGIDHYVLQSGSDSRTAAA